MRILGMEFGAWSLKGVEMESRFRKVEILDLHEIRLPLENFDATNAYKNAVVELMARLPSHPEKIVTSLPPAQTALRFLNLPVKQRKKVETSFKYELEDNIPFKIDDSVIEHHVSRTKEGSLVFAAIAPKRYVQSHIDWLKSVGVDPDWLTFEGMGIINLYLSAVQLNAQKEASVEGPVLLMDMGHLKTNLAILDQGQLRLFRSIAWGGWAITQAIGSNLGIAVEDAEKKKVSELNLIEGEGKDEELKSAAIQALNAFVADISHSLVSFRTQYQQDIRTILLTGGTSRLRGIEGFLSRTLEKPIQIFHPFKEVNLSREIDDTQEIRFGEPLGRAYVFTRKSALLFNFRKAELGKGTSLTEVGTVLKNPNILRLIRYASLFAFFLFLHVIIATPLAEREAKTSTEELKKVFSDTFKSVPTKIRPAITSDPKELKKFIDQKNNEIEQKVKMLSKARLPMMTLVRMISESFPATVKVDVNTLRLDDRTFKLEGVLYEGSLDNVVDNLKKAPALQQVTVTKNDQRFTIQGQVVGR